MIINLLRSNYEFLFYLSLFYSIYILYKKGRDLYLIIKYKFNFIYDDICIHKDINSMKFFIFFD